jgi:DNA polymerase I
MIKFIAKYSVEDVQEGSFKELEDFLRQSKEISLDIETTGLCPHRERVVMIQIGDLKNQFIIDARSYTRTDLHKVLSLLESKDLVKIGANLKFEYKFFLANYGIRLQSLKDVIVQEMILECGRKLSKWSLQALSEKYLSIHMEKDTRMEFTRIGDSPFNLRQITYGVNDIVNPLKINEIQERLIKRDNLEVVTRLENQFVRVIAEKEFNGIYVDKKKWIDLYEQNLKEYHNSKKALDQYVIDNKFYDFLSAPDLFNSDIRCLIEWSSQKQVVPLFKRMKIPTKILDKVKTKSLKEKTNLDQDIFKDSIGRAEMQQYEDKFPLVKLFLKYKKYEKAVTTYGAKWLTDFVNPVTGRVHSDFWQILNTGRISSRYPNIQQIPSFKSKDKLSCEAHRTCFVAPKERWLIVRDYSSQELRILADLSNDESMIDEYTIGGQDLHSLTASKVYSQIRGEKVPVSSTENKHLRSHGKTLNFAISYGASAYKISKSLSISKEEGQDIIDSFYKSFPSLRNFFREGHKFVLSHGYVLIDSFTKRRSYFPFFTEFNELQEKIDLLKKDKLPVPKSYWSDFFTYKGEMERSSQNYRIQGLAASMTKAALVMLYDRLYKEKQLDKVKILLALHDEIVLECDEELKEATDKLLQQFMISAGALFCKKVPMAADGGPCTVWEH